METLINPNQIRDAILEKNSVILRLGSSHTTRRQHFVIKNGFLFVLYGTSLFYTKCSEMKTTATSYETSTNMPNRTEIANFSTTSIGNSDVNQRLWFTTNGNYLYVRNDNTIQRYTVTWGADYSTVAFSDMLTITPQNNGASITMLFIDISADNSKILITAKISNKNTICVLDLTDIETTPTKNITILTGNIHNTNQDYSAYFFTENESYPIAEFYTNAGGTSTGISSCTLYSLSETALTEYKTEEYAYRQHNPTAFLAGFEKFKDNKGNYHIIQCVGYALNNNTDVESYYGYVMVNGATIQTYKCWTSNIGSSFEFAQPVNTYFQNNKYYLFCGTTFLALNQNWEVVADTLVLLNWTTANRLVASFMYDGDCFYTGGSYGYPTYMKLQMWLDKKVASVKTVTVNNKQQQIVMYAQPTDQNIDTGIYD